MKRSRINSSTISLLVPANFCRAIFLIKKFRFEWKTTKVFCPTLVPHPRLLLPEKIIEKHFWLIKQLLPSPVGEKGKRQSFPFFISPSTSFPSHGKGGFSRITRLVQQLIWFGWESVKLVFPLHLGCFSSSLSTVSRCVANFMTRRWTAAAVWKGDLGRILRLCSGEPWNFSFAFSLTTNTLARKA